jgi:transcriptional regulator with XRE-family HTH domain
MDIDALLSRRVRELRKSRKYTLDQLAELSGVSRSMVSLIERQETSPTASVLNKLADALGVSLPALFSQDADAAEKLPVSRCTEQPVWTDPASGYVRRHLSPLGWGSPIELVEVSFPAGETVAFDNPVRSVVTHQQIWVLEGAMDITVGDEVWHLGTGDCLAMELGARIVFHNPSRRPARYALALTTTP